MELATFICICTTLYAVVLVLSMCFTTNANKQGLLGLIHRRMFCCVSHLFNESVGLPKLICSMH